MKFLACTSLLLLSISGSLCVAADSPGCLDFEITAHVLDQFTTYGPRSKNREYFGFVYRYKGVLASAINRGTPCRLTEPCEVKIGKAAALIPKGAKVLGEWHTHPHVAGSANLSLADVRGAHVNRHIGCYRAFFSTPDGEVFIWDVNAAIVSTAMASTVRLGNYRRSGRVQQFASEVR